MMNSLWEKTIAGAIDFFLDSIGATRLFSVTRFAVAEGETSAANFQKRLSHLCSPRKTNRMRGGSRARAPAGRNRELRLAFRFCGHIDLSFSNYTSRKKQVHVPFSPSFCFSWVLLGLVRTIDGIHTSSRRNSKVPPRAAAAYPPEGVRYRAGGGRGGRSRWRRLAHQQRPTA